MISAVAPAKLNLGLRVAAPDASGLHPLESLVTTIDWSDRLTAAPMSHDALEVSGPCAAGIPVDSHNLVWRAIELHRAASGVSVPVSIKLDKHVPASAGLGGGSGDAAAALCIMDELVEVDLAAELAGRLGADVPFALAGGWADMSGYGQRVSAIGDAEAITVGVVVPPIDLSTADVYAAWDALGGPEGPERAITEGPAWLEDRSFVNDLYPAAVALAPELATWERRLAAAWERDIVMSGSGSALFSLFASPAEAEAAVGPFAESARSVWAGVSVAFGAHLSQG